MYNVANLSVLPIWQIPILYTLSYVSRAWGPLLFAFLLGVLIAFVPREKFKQLMASKTLRSYVIAASLAPLLTLCSCAMLPIFGGLLVSGTGMGPAITFLLMAPAANVLAVLFTWELLSWKLALRV